MAKSKRALVTITVVFFTAQIAIIIALANQGRFDYMRSVMGTTGFWLVYTFLEARYDFYMNTYVRVLVSLTIFLDAFFGYYCNLYAASFVFDKLLHVFGTYACSLFAYILLAQLLRNPVAKLVKFILVACLGMSLGASYEILEFFTDSVANPILPSQPSLLDTNVDLVGDAIGALTAAIHAVSRNFVNNNF